LIHDNLPRGVRGHIGHSIRELERFAGPVNDTLDTLQVLARPLTVGLEDKYRALDDLIAEIKSRWAFYEANDAWPNDSEIQGLTRASARTLKNPEDGGQ
jgi:hypothetical protein